MRAGGASLTETPTPLPVTWLAGHDMLKGLNVGIAQDLRLEVTPTSVLVRHVLGAIVQVEKAILVAKLKAARDPKSARDGKCEGRRAMPTRRWLPLPRSCAGGVSLMAKLTRPTATPALIDGGRTQFQRRLELIQSASAT